MATPQMLKELCRGKDTDKDTVHSYVDIYERIFARLRASAREVLEIGVFRGGSIVLWREYFEHARITAVDIKIDAARARAADGRVRLVEGDAYASETLARVSDVRYDLAIDDGPHTLQSMVAFASTYSRLLTDDGILVIEDIQDVAWFEPIRAAFPAELRPHVRLIDRRHIKGRYDDVLVVLDKGPPTA